MYDAIIYLREKLKHLEAKYPQHGKYCAFRMAIISLMFLLKISIKESTYKNIFCVVFHIKGGLGDFLIACNYIYCFHRYVSEELPIYIKLCYHTQSLLDSFCGKLPGVIETGTNLEDLTGTIKVELNRFPRIVYGDATSFCKKSKKFSKLYEFWNNFLLHNRKFYEYSPSIDGLGNDYSQILGSKRVNQADIGGVLKIGESSIFPLFYPIEKEKEFLSKVGLFPKKYITIQRGQGVCYTDKINTKLWPVHYYNKLIVLLKKQYPRYIFVQLGTNKAGYDEDFDNIDFNLRGKTNLEELKIVLRNSILHIDCEGGLVHLRHALNGGHSVVLFGPTSRDFYGYKENLNLRSLACKKPCEWVTDDWLSRCARRTDKNICMESLIPDIVFKEIKRFVRDNNILKN